MTSPLDLPAMPSAVTHALIQGPQGSEYRLLANTYEPESAQHSANQMRDYATAAVLADRAARAKEPESGWMRPLPKPLKEEMQKPNTSQEHLIASEASRLQEDAPLVPYCATCGTLEVSLHQTCHNSACNSYGCGVMIYEGWNVQKSSHPAPAPSSNAAMTRKLGEASQMRAEFNAWVKEQGCDTDGAWSAWQGCWGRRAAQLKTALDYFAEDVEATLCDTCHGSGQVCVGNSGRDDDGNAPIMEPCPECAGEFLAPDAAQVLARVLRCRYPVCTSIHRSGFGWDTSRLNEVIADLAAEHPQQPVLVMGEAIENAHSAPCEAAAGTVVSNEPDEKRTASVGGASAQVQGDER